jgi:multidrug efflux pump
MISRFFIDRPIFATVLSVVITLAGGLAVLTLPTAQYPPISPPQVQVSINYPGASTQVVADTVAAPIEQQVNGVPGMLYMTSLSGNNGTYTLYVTFDVGVDLNTALVIGAEPRAARPAAAAHVGPEPGDLHPQEDPRHPDGD